MGLSDSLQTCAHPHERAQHAGTGQLRHPAQENMLLQIPPPVSDASAHSLPELTLMRALTMRLKMCIKYQKSTTKIIV